MHAWRGKRGPIKQWRRITNIPITDRASAFELMAHDEFVDLGRVIYIGLELVLTRDVMKLVANHAEFRTFLDNERKHIIKDPTGPGYMGGRLT